MKTLADLAIGEKGIVKKIGCEPSVKRNVMTNGMIRGSEVTLTSMAPLGDPLVFLVISTKLSLRAEDAANITIED